MSLTRLERLQHDHQRLQVLAASSSILHFETEGSPPGKYLIGFRGSSTHEDYLNEHDLSIWLCLEYPTLPPEVRFTSHMFHPNVPRSGVVDLALCGIQWDAKLTLAHVVERMWDVARYGFVSLESVANETARDWFHAQREMALPVDGRPLKDQKSVDFVASRRPRRKTPARPKPANPPATGNRVSPSDEGIFFVEDTRPAKDDRQSDGANNDNNGGDDGTEGDSATDDDGITFL